MRTDDRERILLLIEELNAFEGVIIVEGKKDVRALASVGVRSEPLTTSIDEQLEKLSHDHDRVLILTDRDEEGNKILAQARSACERLELTEERLLRRRFFAATRLRQVEGFDTLCGSLRIDTDKSLR